MKLLRNGAITLAFLGVMLLPGANAQAATLEEMLAQIQTLMTQIQELQKQLATIRGDVKEVLRDGLKEGMSDEDIKKIQEMLATDPTIYPGRISDWIFGPLTKQAVMRFQMKNELPVTGEVSSTTRVLLEEYLSEAFGGDIPPGLLRAPGIIKKVELRALSNCEKPGRGLGPLCKKFKVKYGDDDDANDDDDDDSATTTSKYDVSVEIVGVTTTVEFTYKIWITKCLLVRLMKMLCLQL
jgi:peptidoglycan hydrolase-like protein with peptidoglycan-binding domain